MRRILRAVLLSSAAALTSSCSEPAGPVDEWTFTATWADKPWAGKGSAYLVANVLHIAGAKTMLANGPTVELISFEVAAPGVGTFNLGRGQAAFGELSDGYSYRGVYGTTENSVGSVTITRYEGPDGLVEGTVNFDAELQEGSGSYGQRNRLTDGKFSAMVARSVTDTN